MLIGDHVTYFQSCDGLLSTFQCHKQSIQLRKRHAKPRLCIEGRQFNCDTWLLFVLKGPIDTQSALFQVMPWRRTGDKPLPELMLTQFTDACIQH